MYWDKDLCGRVAERGLVGVSWRCDPWLLTVEGRTGDTAFAGPRVGSEKGKMLAILGFATIAVFLAATMSRRVSLLAALVLIPTAFGLVAGHGGTIGSMMLDGIVRVAPVVVMAVFGVLYFGLMLEVGLFDPLIRRLLRLVRGDPLRLALATAVITMVVALDGDGTTTFLIVVSAVLPAWDRIGMSRQALATIVALGAGVMVIFPWGGPTTRAMAALNADAAALFNPLLQAVAGGALWVLLAAFLLGRRERARLGRAPLLQEDSDRADPQPLRVALLRPWLYGFDLGLTILLLAALVAEVLPLPVLFALAFAVALPVNLPTREAQQALLRSHAGSIASIVTTLFAAGIFTGILIGSGMVGAMAEAMAALVPESLARFLPVFVAVTAMPLSLVLPPDAYYFGVLPVLAHTAAGVGIDPVLVGRGAVLGQSTTGFPLSPFIPATYVLLGLCGVSLGAHQRFTFPWAFGTTLVMTAVAAATGALFG